MAPVHVRGLAPDEIASTKPLIREGLEQLKRAAKAEDFIDLSREQVPFQELQRAVEGPVGGEEDMVADAAPAIEESEATVEAEIGKPILPHLSAPDMSRMLSTPPWRRSRRTWGGRHRLCRAHPVQT